MSVFRDGDAGQMADFVRRIISRDSGRVRDEGELQRMAVRHSGGEGDCVRVLNYRHLVSELHACQWVEWAPSPPRPPDGAPAPGGFDLSLPSAPPSCSSGPGGVPPAASSSQGSCALGSEFLGGWEGGLDLRPSAPPAEAAAVVEEGACAQAAGDITASEARLDGRDLQAEPVADFGGVAVCSPPWGLRHLVVRRPFVVVLRHPTDPALGIRLFEGGDLASATAVARMVIDNMHLEPGTRAAPELYHALACDPELRTALANVREDAAEPAPAAAVGPPEGSAPSAAAPEPQAAAAVPPAPAEPEPCDCPICFSEIEATAAVMRCSGDGGRHHYFHSGCLQRWIGQCRAGRAGPTCPVCRGQIQFHAQRLEAFLSSNQAASLAPEDRSFLQQCADRLRGADVQWGEVFTLENAKHYGGLAAAGGWGFVVGYTASDTSLHSQLVAHSLPQQHRVAHGVGWVLGIIARAVREHRREKRRREERASRW